MKAIQPRIDAHQHFWTYSRGEYRWIDDSMTVIARDFGAKDLEPHLRASGLTGCVAVQARTVPAENGYLLGLAERHPFILGVVGWLDLASPHLAHELAEAPRHHRLVGFREILQGEPDAKFLNPAFVRGLRLLGERDYAYDVLVHASQLIAVSHLLRETRDDQRLVLDHLGKPNIRGGGHREWAASIRDLAKNHENLHCKLSGMVTEAAPGCGLKDLMPYMETVVEAFGTKRLMFGSDWPVCLLNAPDYASVHDLAREFIAGLGDEAASDIFGGNAQRFYKLPSPQSGCG